MDEKKEIRDSMELEPTLDDEVMIRSSFDLFFN